MFPSIPAIRKPRPDACFSSNNFSGHRDEASNVTNLVAEFDAAKGDQPPNFRYNLRDLHYVTPAAAAYINDDDSDDDYDPLLEGSREDLLSKKSTSGRSIKRSFRSLTTPEGGELTTSRKSQSQRLQVPVVFKLANISEELWETSEGKQLRTWLACCTGDVSANGNNQDCDNSGITTTNIHPERLRQHNRRLRGEIEYSRHFQDENLWKDIGLGHPAARGCKQCYEVGAECDLIDGERYPCKNCHDDRQICDLIMEPKQKQACRSCSKHRLTCSFRTTEDHQGPCETCRLNEITCIAGPLSGFTCEGPRLDDHRSVQRAQRKFKKTRRPALKCPRGRRSDWENSSCCQDGTDQGQKYHKKSLNLSLDPFIPETDSTASDETGSSHPIVDEKAHIQCPPETRGNDLEQTRGDPNAYGDQIYFNCDASPKYALLCEWCMDVYYGLCGPPPGNVTPGAMCVICTGIRLRVIGCARHTLGTLTATKGIEFVSHDIVHFLRRGMASQAPWNWCFVCPQPAQFACCASGLAIKDGGGKQYQGGCGPLLCELCAVQMTADAKGDLARLIRIKEQALETASQLRFDAGFLCRDGLLIQWMKKTLLRSGDHPNVKDSGVTIDA